MKRKRSRTKSTKIKTPDPPPPLTPLSIIPQECWTEVFSFTTNSDLASVVPVVCKDYFEIITHADKKLWKPRCLNLWRDKVESSWRPYLENTSLPFRAKFLQSLSDSRRQNLTTDDLCSVVWSFRFKAAAGEWWTQMDPYWNSNRKTYMTRAFRADGSCYNPGSPMDALDAYGIEHGWNIKWRFTKSRKCAAEDGNIIRRRGQFLQLNRWPSAGIERSDDDWGWVIQNQWVVYTYPASNLVRMHDRLESDVDRWL